MCIYIYVYIYIYTHACVCVDIYRRSNKHLWPVTIIRMRERKQLSIPTSSYNTCA